MPSCHCFPMPEQSLAHPGTYAPSSPPLAISRFAILHSTSPATSFATLLIKTINVVQSVHRPARFISPVLLAPIPPIYRKARVSSASLGPLLQIRSSFCALLNPGFFCRHVQVHTRHASKFGAKCWNRAQVFPWPSAKVSHCSFTCSYGFQIYKPSPAHLPVILSLLLSYFNSNWVTRMTGKMFYAGPKSS